MSIKNKFFATIASGILSFSLPLTASAVFPFDSRPEPGSWADWFVPGFWGCFKKEEYEALDIEVDVWNNIITNTYKRYGERISWREADSMVRKAARLRYALGIKDPSILKAVMVSTDKLKNTDTIVTKLKKENAESKIEISELKKEKIDLAEKKKKAQNEIKKLEKKKLKLNDELEKVKSK